MTGHLTGWSLTNAVIVNVELKSPNLHVLALSEDSGAAEGAEEHKVYTKWTTDKD